MPSSKRLRKRAWIDQYAPKPKDFAIARDVPERLEARPQEDKRVMANDLDFPNEF